MFRFKSVKCGPHIKLKTSASIPRSKIVEDYTLIGLDHVVLKRYNCVCDVCSIRTLWSYILLWGWKHITFLLSSNCGFSSNWILLYFHCSCVRPCVTGVTSHISHIYKGINAMLIIRGPIKPYIFWIKIILAIFLAKTRPDKTIFSALTNLTIAWLWLWIIKNINAESAVITLSCFHNHHVLLLLL